jgi:hypothetical protein
LFAKFFRNKKFINKKAQAPGAWRQEAFKKHDRKFLKLFSFQIFSLNCTKKEHEFFFFFFTKEGIKDESNASKEKKKNPRKVCITQKEILKTKQYSPYQPFNV